MVLTSQARLCLEACWHCSGTSHHELVLLVSSCLVASVIHIHAVALVVRRSAAAAASCERAAARRLCVYRAVGNGVRLAAGPGDVKLGILCIVWPPTAWPHNYRRDTAGDTVQHVQRHPSTHTPNRDWGGRD